MEAFFCILFVFWKGEKGGQGRPGPTGPVGIGEPGMPVSDTSVTPLDGDTHPQP